MTSESFSGLLGVGYAVLDGPEGHLDVVGGAKLWSVDTTISFNGGILGDAETRVWKVRTFRSMASQGRPVLCHRRARFVAISAINVDSK